MVHFPDAQGSRGEAAEPSQTTCWLTCLWESSVDKDLSRDAGSLVGRAPALRVDEDT
jgi:hypothetical protein